MPSSQGWLTPKRIVVGIGVYLGGNYAWPAISAGLAGVVTTLLHNVSGLSSGWNNLFLLSLFVLISGLTSFALQGARRFVRVHEAEANALLNHRVAILKQQLAHLHFVFGHSKQSGLADAVENVFQLKIEPQIKNEIGDPELLQLFYDDTGFQQSSDGSRDAEVRNFVERRIARLKDVLALMGSGPGGKPNA